MIVFSNSFVTLLTGGPSRLEQEPKVRTAADDCQSVVIGLRDYKAGNQQCSHMLSIGFIAVAFQLSAAAAWEPTSFGCQLAAKARCRMATRALALLLVTGS